MNEQGFHVEIDDKGCEHCGRGATYIIVDPHGVGGSVSFFEKQDADDACDLLNDAYQMGKEAAVKGE